MSTMNTTFVEVPEKRVTPTGAISSVRAQFDYMKAYADEQKLKAAEVISKVEQVLTSLKIPDNLFDELDDVVIGKIQPIDIINRPVPGVPELDNSWPTNHPVLGMLVPAPNVNLQYTKPVKPVKPGRQFYYGEMPYNSEMWVALFSKILSDINLAGSTGINEEVETALKERARERIRQAISKKYDADMRAAGPSGFNYPSSLTIEIQHNASTEMLRQEIDSEREILITTFDRAQKNYFFAMELGRGLETIYRDFHNSRENRTLEAEKAAVQFVLQTYTTDLEAFKADWDGIKLQIEVAIAELNRAESQNRITLGAFEAEAKVFQARIENISEKNKSISDSYMATIEGYKAGTDLLETYYRVASEQQKNELMVADLQLKKAIAKLEALLQGDTNYKNIQEKMFDMLTRVIQQAISSALNAINASMHHGYSGSESLSEGFSHGDSVQESHSYSET